MKLVLDATGVKTGGGATVVNATLQAAVSIDRFRAITLLASPAALRRYPIPTGDKVRVVDMTAAESSGGRILWNLRGLDRYLRNMECDVFFHCHGIGYAKKVPSFITIQQALPYSKESLLLCSRQVRFRMAVIRWLSRRAARAAEHVFVQTEVMRDTLSREFGVPKEHISTFLPCAPILPRPETDSPKLKSLRSDSERGVLLYVGNSAPYKNLSVVAEGLRRMPESKRPKWYATLPAGHPLCLQGDVIGLGTLDGAELFEAYRHARVLVMPSLIETVGLPMLEAMRMGTPVLAADRPYARAVCEDAATLFNPLSPDDFAEKAMLLFSDVERRADLVKRGIAVVKRLDAVDPYRAMLEKVVKIIDAKKS